MYTVICDNCSKSADEDSEYSCWGEEDTAREVADNASFVEHEGKDYCPECAHFNDDDELVIIPNC